MNQRAQTRSSPGKRRADHTKRMVDLLVNLLQSIGGSRSLALAIALRNGEPRAVLDLPFVPTDYNDPTEFARAWQAHRLLSKCDFLDFGIDVKGNASRGFRAAEEHCRLVNHRLDVGPQQGRGWRILRIAREKILRLLGDDPVPHFQAMLEGAEWGRGSTSSCKGEYVQRYNKLGSDAEYSPQIEPFLSVLRDCRWFPSGSERAVRGNTVTFVPKSYKTMRTIAVEPTVNSALQRGIGKVLRDRLLTVGVNTRDQTLNQRLAKRGSVDGSYSTIDLSSASDTLSRRIIEYLLPPRWHHLLDSLRSPMYFMDGRWEFYHKFSSMGNGFTFELETLVFWSIAKAATELYSARSRAIIAVYGDDMVVPSDADPFVRGALRTAGFVVNHDKSFRKGLFRESCGEEYFHGVRCTPYYARGWGDNFSLSMMTLGNYLRRFAPLWVSWQRGWLAAYTNCPGRDRLCGPPGATGAFWVNPWDIPASSARHVVEVFGPWPGWRYSALAFVPKSTPLEGETAVRETSWRLEERRLLDNLPFGDLLLPHDRVNTARDRGRWVRRPFFVEDWPVGLVH